MSVITNGIVVAIGLGLTGMPAVSQAESMKDPNAPKLITDWGTAISVGGGVVVFTDDAMRDFADTGGGWEARVVAGTRRRLAVEAAYTGAAQSVDALGLDSSALLVGTGLELLGRFNAMTTEWQPYVVAGVGWRRYDVTNADFNTSSVSDEDNLVEIPFGAGVAYRYRGFVADLRTMVRLAFEEDLVNAPSDATSTRLHTWGVNLTGGWEF